MKIIERDEKGISIFRPQGRVDSQGSVGLDTTLQAAIVAGKIKIVLDMAEVDYISSAGLRTLADISTKTAQKGGGFKLVALHHKVLRVFRIIGFDKLFDIYDTVEAAIDAF